MKRPTGWNEAPLGEITQNKVFQAQPGKSSVPYVDIGSIDRDSKRIGETEKVNAANAPTRARQWVREGDVLVSMTRPNLNAVAIVTREFDNAVASTGFDVLRAIEILPKWIFYRVRSEAFVQDVCKDVQGVVYPAIRPDDIRRHVVPIPPRPEQERIIEVLESHLSRLDDARASLHRAHDKLKAYRASVLKAAVEGRLVPTEAELARAEDREYEPADVLLKRILAERRRRWEEGELAKLQASNNTSKRDKWKTTYTEPLMPDTTGLPRLPEGWCWSTVDQLTCRITSGSRDWTQFYDRGSAVFLMAQNIRPGRLDLSFRQFVDPPGDDTSCERSQVFADDLLVTIVGANTGQVCRVPTQLAHHYVCQSVALMRPIAAGTSRFMDHYLNSPNGQAVYEQFMYGQGRPHLSFDQLRRTPIPLPPADEQSRISDDIEHRISISENNVSAAATASRRCGRLRQAILKSAFEGHLVAQDPNDEPAEKLLERVRTKHAESALTESARARRAKTLS